MSKIFFDTDPVDDEKTRVALHAVMHQLKWRSFKGGTPSAGARHEPVVVIGNAMRIVDCWHERVERLLRTSHKNLVVFAIVTKRGDEDALPDLVARCNSNLVLFQCKVQRESTRNQAWAQSYLSAFERVVEGLSPERIRSACFADGELVVSFGDGFSHASSWEDLPFAGRKPRLIPYTLRVSEEMDAIVVDDDAGNEVDIDSIALRAMMDPKMRAEIADAATAADRVFGRRLRAVREEHQMTQEQLTKKSGIPQESLSRMETGTREPRISTLTKYASGLGLSLAELLARLSAPQ